VVELECFFAASLKALCRISDERSRVTEWRFAVDELRAVLELATDDELR